jgi:hypothetical protein
VTWLRIDDEFPEHSKIMALKGAGAKWLHLVALCQCASNLTDGRVDPQRLKVICAIADVPRPAHCVKRLVEAGLWVEDGEGYMIKDYLDYNPDAATVKAKREQRRQAGIKAAEARWKPNEPHNDSDNESHGGSDAISGMHPDPDPNPLVNPDRPGDDRNSGNLEILSYGHALRLFASIRDGHKDDGTRSVITSYASRLSPADFENVREQLENGRHKIKHEGAWVNTALKKLAEKKAAA